MTKTIQQLDEMIASFTDALHHGLAVGIAAAQSTAATIESLANARAALIQPIPRVPGETVLSGRLLMLGREVYDKDGEEISNANGDHRSVLAVVLVAPGEAATLAGEPIEPGGWYYRDRWATLTVHPEERPE